MTTQRFKIGDRLYDKLSIDEISLKDMVLFNVQVAELGLPYTWADAERIARELDALDVKAAGGHPDIMFATAVSVWISRRGAGEDLTFGEAIDIPMSAITIVPVPGDHKSGKAGGAKKAAPRKKGSGQGAARRPKPVESV